MSSVAVESREKDVAEPAALTYRYFRPILEKAKLPRMRLYDLRHSHATLLLAAHEPLKVVSLRWDTAQSGSRQTRTPAA